MGDWVSGKEFLDKIKQTNDENENSFTQFSKFLDMKAREKGIPIDGQFELTPFCNFDCKMCYVHLLPEQTGGYKILSTDTWKNLIRQAWERGMISATLTGGECLTYPGFDELYLYLQNLGCEVHILTNGFLLNEQRIRFFLEHRPRSIQVTLYGWNDDVYERVTGQRAFSTVSGNIRNAVAAGLHVTICVTPSSFLGEDVMETVKVGMTLGNDLFVNDCLFSPREETGRAQLNTQHDMEQYIRIYRLINKIRGIKPMIIDNAKLPPVGGSSHECSECGLTCGGGRSCFVIDWKGTMMPCNMLNIIRSYPLEEDFYTAWKKINNETNQWPRVPECNGCPYDQVCNICAGKMIAYAKPGEQPKELCERIKYYAQHGVVHIPKCD